MPIKATVWTVLALFGMLTFAQEGKKMSLEEALVTAVQRNLDIQLQRINLETSSISLEETRVRYEPVVTSSLSSYSYKQEASNTTQGSAGQAFTTEATSLNSSFRKSQDWGMDWSVTFDNNLRKDTSRLSLGETYGSTFSLSGTQQLLKGFSWNKEIRRSDEYIARGNRAVADADFANQIRSILEQTENAYWDLVFSIEDLKVKQQSLRLAQQLYDQNKIKIEVGTLASIDLVQTESEIASRERDIVASENSVRAAEDRLKMALNLPVEDWTKGIVPTETFKITEQTPDLTKDLEVALANRPEMVKNRLQMENAILSRKVSNNDLKPELSVTTRYQTVGQSSPFQIDDVIQDATYQTALNKVLFTQYPGWQVSLDLNWRPFNKQGKVALSKANAELRRAELSAEQTKLTILNDVRTAGRELQANWEAIKANEKNVQFQKANVKAENQKFQNGLSTNYEVSQAQNNLSTAESQLLSSKIGYLKAMVGYEKALGLLLKNRKIQVD